MNCYVCDEPSPYPVCNSCSNEGYDINKIISGEQKPKFDVSKYRHFIFKETLWYNVFAKDKDHAKRKVDGSMRTKVELVVVEQKKLG